jgi:hypothetical protein
MVMDNHLAQLEQIVAETTLDARQIAQRTARIHNSAPRKSSFLREANFQRVHPSDLQILFELYDRAFFRRQLTIALGPSPLEFRLSRRMTSSGGKTTCFTERKTGNRRFEICVASSILLACFAGDDHRPITVSGIPCRDRLSALQRILEHEIVHLIEMLVWNKSSCSLRRFQSIARRFFGHQEHKHQLITPRERIFAKHGIQPGTKVRFRFDGAELSGIVNRINKRVTVLVANRRGRRYSDGKRYAAYYVPADGLQITR